jgi:hypothetical protein
MPPSGMLRRVALVIVLLRSVRRLLCTANAVPRSTNLVTLMMEALLFSETSVLMRAARPNITEDDILYLIVLENLWSGLEN